MNSKNDKSFRYKYYGNENKYLDYNEKLIEYNKNRQTIPITNYNPNNFIPFNSNQNHCSSFNNLNNTSPFNFSTYSFPIVNTNPNSNNFKNSNNDARNDINDINKKNDKPKHTMSMPKSNLINKNLNNIDNTINLMKMLAPFEIYIEQENIDDRNKNNTKSNKELKKIEREKISKYQFQLIDNNIQNINDLITLGKEYDTKYKDTKKLYPIDIKILNQLVEPLTLLNNMVGLDTIKKKIFEQIIFYLQNLDDENYDMLHTVIYGDPGIGKTELAKILGKIYTALGILSKGTFTSVKRADLIGGYLGQTAMKTKKVLDEAIGGVLFIDEAYSLGNKEGKDSYSKECIDTLNAALTEEKEDLIVIIAGYKNDLENCFFSHNSGLERRFNWRFELTKYSPAELREIFIKKANEKNWNILSNDDISLSFFETNIEHFKFNGGDMETLFQKCKMAHAHRVLKEHPKNKKYINKDDLENGFQSFIESRKTDERYIKYVDAMYI